VIQTTKEITQALQAAADLRPQILKSLIVEHREGDGSRLVNLWKRYTLDGVPIKKREPANYEKVDRRTANDFYADVVDTKVGYMGNEVSVTLKRDYYTEGDVFNEAGFYKGRDFLSEWQGDNDAEDDNSEMVLYAAACGVGYRHIYFDHKDRLRSKNWKPWEVIYVYDSAVDDPQMVIRYYTIRSEEFGDKSVYKDYTVAEWYDINGITYWIDDGRLNFSIDETMGTGGFLENKFDVIPVLPFENNSLLTGEPEKVIDLIDAYDAIISSTTSEVEQLRLAYMFVKDSGLLIDDKFIKQLEQTGIFALGENGEIGFINKQLADAPVHSLLAEIRKNIYQFAKSVDMSKDFGGDMRVIGWQVALLNLENSSKITERKFKKSLRTQYQIIFDFWRRAGIADLDYRALDFTFTRNFPRDLRAEAETLQLLLNTVSTGTAFSLMSFIDDPEAELLKIENERGTPYEDIDDADEGLTEELETVETD